MAGILDCVEYTSGQRTQRLLRAHDIEIEIRFDVEELQRVVEHRAMLTGVDNGSFKFVGPPAEFLNHNGKLDGLWPRAQNGNDSTLLHGRTPVVSVAADQCRGSGTSSRFGS